VLDDAWLKRQGAALMGKTRGEAKARSPELARKAALARWELKDGREADAKQPQSLEEEVAQEKHRRKFVRPLKKPVKKPVRRKKKS
jgi:hypothetical protein